MSSMSPTRTAAWSVLGDLDGIMHPRDIIALDHRERARHATRFTQSDGLHPMTKGWAAYNRAIVPVVDQYGKEHLITEKTFKVYMNALSRITRDDTSTTLREMATEIGVCAQTVSNALRRFMAWGILGYGSVRGKYGGLILFARHKGDGLERYVRLAWESIRAAWDRKTGRIRAQSNVQTYPQTETVRSDVYGYVYRVDIKKRERDDRIEETLRVQLHGGSKRVKCPAHGGEDRNLSFWRRPDGSLGVKCWSHQCAERDIKDAVERWA